MSIEYYVDKEEGARVKALNLRNEYGERKYCPPFKISPLINSGQGTYAIQDASGMIIAHTWRLGVDAERIVEALNYFYAPQAFLVSHDREKKEVANA